MDVLSFFFALKLCIDNKNIHKIKNHPMFLIMISDSNDIVSILNGFQLYCIKRFKFNWAAVDAVYLFKIETNALFVRDRRHFVNKTQN